MKKTTAIKKAWEGAKSNDEAATALLSMAKGDNELMSDLMEPHLDRIVREAVGEYKRDVRGYIWTRPVAPDNRVAALARANALSLFDLRLPSGLRLGDATAKDVAEARDYYASEASKMAAKAGFFGALVEVMKGGKTVQEQFDATDLEKLRYAA